MSRATNKGTKAGDPAGISHDQLKALQELTAAAKTCSVGEIHSMAQTLRETGRRAWTRDRLILNIATLLQRETFGFLVALEKKLCEGPWSGRNLLPA